jgi:branched-chain amino acid transport system substrate-binding protein
MGLALMASGCGGGEGVEEGATVTVYAAAAACRGAQRVLESEGSRVSSLHLRVRCLPAVEKHGRFDLATIGANARRATEDSSTIAYIGEIEPAATRFSEPILEEAGIAQLPHMPGAAAMHELLNVLERVDTSSGSLRESVRDELR